MAQKWVKNGLKKWSFLGPKSTQTRQKRGPFWDPFLSPILHRMPIKSTHFGSKMGPKMGQKMTPKTVKMAIFGHFWDFFGQFLVHFLAKKWDQKCTGAVQNRGFLDLSFWRGPPENGSKSRILVGQNGHFWTLF